MIENFFFFFLGGVCLVELASYVLVFIGVRAGSLIDIIRYLSIIIVNLMARSMP